MPRRKGSAAVARRAAPESAETVLSSSQVRRLDELEFAESWLATLRAAQAFVDAAPTLTRPSQRLDGLTRELARAARNLHSVTIWMLGSSRE